VAKLTFADAIQDLRHYDQEPLDGQVPTIYVAEPWAPTSEASIEWSGPKGGVPLGRKPILLHFTTVRGALKFFGPEYDELVAEGEAESMCRKIANHISQRNAQRVPHDA
jgi:hypothetical protein